MRSIMSGAMKINVTITLLMSLLVFPVFLFADWAALETNEGLGKYYYIEADATTFIHWSTDWASWSSASVYLDMNGSTAYEYSSSWAHDDGSNKHLNTSNLSSSNHSNWAAGVLIDFYLKLNDGTKATYNDRLRIIDITTSTSGLATSIVDNPSGSQNLVMSFKIDAGSGASEELDRLWVTNIASSNPAQEGDDITSDGGIYLYWETATGSESFAGTESSFNLNGNSGSATDETWGHDAVTDGSGGIDIPDAGLRCYIVVQDLASGYTSTNNVKFAILIDGISMNNGLMRIDQSASGGSDVSLPVILTSFEASNKKGAVELAWVTESEIDNLGFLIERAVGGSAFEEIANFKFDEALRGQGSTTARTEYVWADKQVVPGIVYEYVLADVDINQKVVRHTDNKVRIKAELNNEQVGIAAGFKLANVAPNPFNPSTEIHFAVNDDLANSPYSIVILDITGREVQKLSGLATSGINVAQWNGHLSTGNLATSGIYFARINVNNVSQVVKMTLMR